MREPLIIGRSFRPAAAIVLLCPLLGAFGARGQQTAAPAEHCIRCESFDTRKAPKYRVATRIKTTDGRLMVYVSIPNDRFGPEDLSRLACRLETDFRNEAAVLVLIFDDYQSAKRYVPRGMQEKPSTWQQDERSQRASYLRERAGGSHWIAWYNHPGERNNETLVPFCPAGSKGSGGSKQ